MDINKRLTNGCIGFDLNPSFKKEVEAMKKCFHCNVEKTFTGIIIDGMPACLMKVEFKVQMYHDNKPLPKTWVIMRDRAVGFKCYGINEQVYDKILVKQREAMAS